MLGGARLACDGVIVSAKRILCHSSARTCVSVAGIYQVMCLCLVCLVCTLCVSCALCVCVLCVSCVCVCVSVCVVFVFCVCVCVCVLRVCVCVCVVRFEQWFLLLLVSMAICFDTQNINQIKSDTLSMMFIL